MSHREEVEILLVEDDSEDIKLTLYALYGEHLSNRVQVVRDGKEALDLHWLLVNQPPPQDAFEPKGALQTAGQGAPG